MEIENSIALVTGANRGIGSALVEALLAHGVKRVYAAARKPSHLDAVASSDRDRVIPLQLDVTKPDDLTSAASKAKDITLLVNNAGVLDFGNVLEAPPEAYRRNFDVNFFGLLSTTRAFAPALIENNGTVVNILTLVALASMPGLGVYNASKAAAWSLTQSMRADLSKQGVKVLGVFPGAVDTDMLKGVEMPKTSPRDIAKAVLAGIEEGNEDIFPDPMSTQLYAAWKADHKAVEHRFAAM